MFITGTLPMLVTGARKRLYARDYARAYRVVTATRGELLRVGGAPMPIAGSTAQTRARDYLSSIRPRTVPGAALTLRGEPLMLRGRFLTFTPAVPSTAPTFGNLGEP